MKRFLIVPKGTTILEVNAKREPISMFQHPTGECADAVQYHRDGTVSFHFASSAPLRGRLFEADQASVRAYADFAEARQRDQVFA